MELQRTYGLAMELPEGKLPGFYAQVIKALAAKSPILDRDKELLIFSTPEEREASVPVMNQYSISYDKVQLLLLPDSIKTLPVFTDYGWTTRSEHTYVNADDIFIYQLEAESPEAEPEQALIQLEEHLWASFPLGEPPVESYLTDMQSAELVERIALAYKCKVKPVLF